MPLIEGSDVKEVSSKVRQDSGSRALHAKRRISNRNETANAEFKMSVGDLTSLARHSRMAT